MRKIAAVLLLAVCTMLMLPGASIAKDEVLRKSMAELDLAYVPPLFYTSVSAPPTLKSMNIYKAVWAQFAAQYYDYRPNDVNWRNYFDSIDDAVQRADAIVREGTNLPAAHNVLEEVRMLMLELRTRNGFNKIVTDRLTAFHHPMEGIVLSVKGKTPADIDADLLEHLEDLLDEAWFMYHKIELCPLDPALWNFTIEQEDAYYENLANLRGALENFENALTIGEPQSIIQTGVAIKPRFRDLFILFGDFASVMAN